MTNRVQNTINFETTEKKKKKNKLWKSAHKLFAWAALFDNNWCTMCTFCGCWLFMSCGFSLFAAHSHSHKHIFMLIILYSGLKDLFFIIIISRLNLSIYSNYSHFELQLKMCERVYAYDIRLLTLIFSKYGMRHIIYAYIKISRLIVVKCERVQNIDTLF